VNTLNTEQQALRWKALTQAALDLEADILCIQETNTNWITPTIQVAKNIFNTSAYRASKVSTTASNAPTSEHYQPGGTLTAALGKWTARAYDIGQDTSGLGRWSYITLRGSNNITYVIASGYRVGPKPPTLGANTAYDQQYRLLLAKGNTQPKPRQQFVEDLIQQVKQWRAQQYEVLFCIDANEDVENLQPDQEFGPVLAETDLVDLHDARHPNQPRPATHQRGSRPIDIILASPRFINAMTAAYILPFGQPITMPGDHRTLGADFDTSILFGNKSPPPTRYTQTRGVQSNALPLVKRYCEIVTEKWSQMQIPERLAPLTTKERFTEMDHQTLEAIDKDLTQILVKADQQCSKFKTTPWSPKLHMAYIEHRYWALQASSLKTGRNYDHLLEQLRQKLGITNNDKNHKHTIRSNLRRIQQTFRDIRQEAADHRKTFLHELMIAANTTKDKNRQKLIRHLQTAETNRRCFAITKAILKPHTAGGLTHVLDSTDNGSTWESTTEREDMENKLLTHSQQHFSQAHGMPYTVAPLKELLQYNGLTEFGDQVFNGTIPEDLNVSNTTRLLLENQKSALLPNEDTSHPLNFEGLMAGFKKWPEKTATSPSGRHLGIYKSLLKDTPDKEDHKKAPPKMRGIQVMQSIFTMLQLAVKHTHTFNRWKVIWNMYLEKDLGSPKLSRLRTIHLMEADYNLLLKWYAAQGFFKQCERFCRLADEQGGSRQGRSAIDLACKKVVIYDILRTTKDEAIDVGNDAAACFDRMIESCQNLSCRQQGADIEYLRLHAQTHEQLRYYVKHAYGVSIEYNEYTPEHPWYGAGQGAGDATIRWAVLSHSLITAYKQQATMWTLTDPTNTTTVTQGIDAFCDDTSLLDANNAEAQRTTAELVQTTQTNLTLWNGLLEASGGALNPTKCTWAHFKWYPKNDLLQLQLHDDSAPTHELQISRLSGEPSTLVQLQPHTPYRYLGIHLTMNGDWKKELKVLQTRNQNYMQVLSKCALTRREVNVIYRQCYLPAVTYPLPAAVIPIDKLDKAQQSITTAFLTKMGYPRTFPRAVAYAPKAEGGVGLLSLSAEQGTQKVLQIIKHLRAHTTTGTIYRILVSHYQLQTGFTQPILENNIPIPWSQAYWMDNLRAFLFQINGQIILHEPWTPKPRRANDRSIMEALLKAQLTLSTHETKIINNVRIHLQANTLSDISDHSGTHIRPECLCAPLALSTIGPSTTANHSTLRWPQHATPSDANWRLWSKTIRHLFSANNTAKLTEPLGKWNAAHANDFEWNWRICPTTFHLYNRHQNTWVVYAPSNLRRTYVQYHEPPTNADPTRVPQTPATPETTATGLKVNLPITTIVHSPINSPTPVNKLIHRLITPPQQWETSLWHKVRPHSNLFKLHEQLGHGRTVFLVSDASVNHRGHGTTAWIIHSQTKLWSGEGIVAGPHDEVYSGLAEVYGVYTALSFLQNYLRQFPTTYESKPRVYVCCDNQGVITRINNNDTSPANPNHTIFDEYGVYHEIQQILHALCAITVRFIHILGHQDTRNKRKPLSLEAQLNVECDAAATKLHTLISIEQYPQDHPQIPSAAPHLLLNGRNVIRHTKQVMRDAYVSPSYRKYLTTKYNWQPAAHRRIVWQIITIASNRFNASERQIIQKFTHGWLPLQTRPQVTSTSENRLCPSCKRIPEDMAHFLSCTHPLRKPAMQTLQSNLAKLHQKHDMDPNLHQILWQGITSLILQHELPNPEDQYPQPYQRLFQAQQALGWIQILHGRYTHEWITMAQMHGTNGTLFYAKVTQFCWQYIITSWTERNRALHDRNEPYDTSQLRTMVQQIFHDAAQHPHLEATIRDQTVESILTRPLRSITAWAQRSAMHIRDHTKAVATRAKLNNTDIRSFFQKFQKPTQASHTEKNLLRPP